MVDKKTVFLFPGQGAQYIGMGKDLYESSPQVRELFETASGIAGKDMAGVLFNGTEEDLKSTDNTQIGITLINLSAAQILKEKGVSASACAGFSLGEFAAYAEAGILGTEEVLKIVLERGRIMQRTCSNLSAARGPCGMAAVLGLNPEKAEGIIAGSGLKEVYAANHNSPVQIVLSGTEEGLKAAEPVFKEAGAKRFIPLKVAGPFHSPLMVRASEEFGEYLKDIEFKSPQKPCYSNVTGSIIKTGTEAKELCPKHIVSPVRWIAIEKEIINSSYDNCLETGPGRVLTGLWDKMDNRGIPCRPAGTRDDMEKILSL